LARTQLAYWKRALAGLPDQLELPTDRPRPPVASSEGDTVPFALDPATHRALKQLAAATGTTVFMTVQAGLAALLMRHGCGTDIPLGTPVAGRDDDATADLVGFFTNTVVLRADTSGDPAFRVLLERVRGTTLAAYEHDALPFDQLVEELNPPRSLARHPLFQVMLAWQSIPDGPFALGPGTTARLAAVPSGTAKFDLTLNAGELPDEGGIGGFLEFRTDLFDRATAEALADRLARLLAAAARTPDTPLGLLPLLSAEEHHHALVTVNRPAVQPRPHALASVDRPTPQPHPHTPSTIDPTTAQPHPHTLSSVDRTAAQPHPHTLATIDPTAAQPRPQEPVTLADVYERAAARHPHRAAVSHAGHTLTHAELSARAHRLARLLADRGIGPGAIVALALPRSADLVTGLLAVALSGAAYLPLDPDYPADRLAYMLGDARPAALLTDTATAPRLPAE
ncbi:condensation domain-containing protein, partial [Streptomyces sp. NPDC005904]|uniref:condensation domain-containing protein n=1 Tax=Streptomyces sp. NPDC005904 TaxID=3154570 RepID=UPI0033E9A07C